MHRQSCFEAISRLLTFKNYRSLEEQLKFKEQVLIHYKLKKYNKYTSAKEVRRMWHNERKSLPFNQRIKIVINDVIDLYGRLISAEYDEDKLIYRFSANKEAYLLTVQQHLKYFALNKKNFWEPRKIAIENPKRNHTFSIHCLESDIKSIIRTDKRTLYGPDLNLVEILINHWHSDDFINKWSTHTYKVYEGHIKVPGRSSLDSIVEVPLVVSFDTVFLDDKHKIQAKIESDSRWRF